MSDLNTDEQDDMLMGKSVQSVLKDRKKTEDDREKWRRDNGMVEEERQREIRRQKALGDHHG